MLFSKLFFYTLREEPQDAEIISHKLMLRAGLIRKLASGIYTFLPLGFRVLKKVENIVREEMNKAGAQEILMPALHPQELWEETGRDKTMSEILMRVLDRQRRNFLLGTTHEEVITDLVRSVVKSYRQLPFILYQIQTKFRDEPRPRFGTIRAREFIMKDAYSFERNEEELQQSYQKMYQAYCNIFLRCGLKFKVVEAFSGAIGGEVSHEFMALAESGEDVLISCSKCDYAANLEKAEGESDYRLQIADCRLEGLKKVATPNMKTVEEVCDFLNIKPQNIVKTLIYQADEEPIAVLIRGDQQINEAKLKNLLKCNNLLMASAKVIEEVSNAPVGFTGPVGLNIKIIADKQILNLRNFTTGANEKDTHLINVNIERDFKIEMHGDIRMVKEGDKCLRCKEGNLILNRGIELGHIFKLGTLYSSKMSAIFLNENGEKTPIVMGCYGIGVTRIIPAIIEQNYDKDGIIWPSAVAPYKIVIIQIKNKDKLQTESAIHLYNNLQNLNYEVVLDDREERPGVKFKDADLIGFPIRVVIGEKIKNKKVELKLRKNNDIIEVEENKIIEKIKEIEKEI